ncbi:hypothetical protein GWK47_000007 [Chionoecetes opilio]|uniref:Uncharacterized protein n=1 Tax=Chionoecetes opilio TaxID=41210 RepID=A0A8J5CPP1_CHIOP|nr:hypothetical protein GWK47_000007 [Chionoecetes opilio]
MAAFCALLQTNHQRHRRHTLARRHTSRHLCSGSGQDRRPCKCIRVGIRVGSRACHQKSRLAYQAPGNVTFGLITKPSHGDTVTRDPLTHTHILRLVVAATHQFDPRRPVTCVLNQELFELAAREVVYGGVYNGTDEARLIDTQICSDAVPLELCFRAGRADS